MLPPTPAWVGHGRALRQSPGEGLTKADVLDPQGLGACAERGDSSQNMGADR